MSSNKQGEKNIFDWTPRRVKNFMLKGSSYCTLKLPEYFKFDSILKYYDKILSGKEYSSFCSNCQGNRPDDYDDVSYFIFAEKSKLVQWRCIKLLNPFLYVALINEIATNWNIIVESYKKMTSNKNIICCSIVTNEKYTTRRQINNWYNNFELGTVELSNKFEWMLDADISNCYSSIYTHSIGWAIDGKEKSKINRNGNGDRRQNSPGFKIDKLLRLMQYGQTNGIPEGNECSNLIAELILAYIDDELSKKIKDMRNNVDYRILRYRDDYRIFCHSKEDAVQILNLLSRTLDEVGLKINDKKTILTDNILKNAMKDDKEYALLENINRFNNSKKDSKLTLLEYIRLIWLMNERFPGSGTVRKLLTSFNKFMISKIKTTKGNKAKSLNIKQVSAYLIDIMYKAPNSHPNIISILSILLKYVPNDIEEIINDIYIRFKMKPYTEYFEIWFQRLCMGYKVCNQIEYQSKICKFVINDDGPIWNFKWLKMRSTKYDFIDRKMIKKVTNSISYDRINEFEDWGRS